MFRLGISVAEEKKSFGGYSMQGCDKLVILARSASLRDSSPRLHPFPTISLALLDIIN
jgi:hypothetical protein